MYVQEGLFDFIQLFCLSRQHVFSVSISAVLAENCWKIWFDDSTESDTKVAGQKNKKTKLEDTQKFSGVTMNCKEKAFILLIFSTVEIKFYKL